MSAQKDVLLYISDQHSWQQGLGPDEIIRTPNLDRIARECTAMQNCCTSFPLCVPARMSMMSGQLASNCNVMSNSSALDSNRVTFAHCLNTVGYETVLCGRMHFVGPDQRHGFSQRIAGEFTPIYHNRPSGAFKEERGVHLNTPTGTPACLRVIGGGNSPTLEYDRYVIEKAEEYLSGSYSKPQLLVVGTYAPHHPYVAPKELYEYYYDKVTVPEETFHLAEHPAQDGKVLMDRDPETVRAVRAAYYGMIEFEDQNIGRVYDAFQAYLKRTSREGVFIFVSDHGDQVGYRGYYGKGTFYESSVHVPMVFAGSGIGVDRRYYGANSLMDVGPTICDIAGAPHPPREDGCSLLPQLSGGADDTERIVISEVTASGRFTDPVVYGQMAKKGNLKYIHFHGFDDADVMYDIASDPLETTNVIGSYPQAAEQMRRELSCRCMPAERIRQNDAQVRENLAILAKCDYDSPERWRTPECARHYPDPMVCSKKYESSVKQ